MRAGEVAGVGQVLDVQLQLQGRIQRPVHGAVEADEAWQGDRVVDVGVDRTAIDDAQSHAEAGVDVVTVPQRGRVPRQLRQPVPGPCACGLGGGDLAGLPGVPAHQLPRIGDAAGDLQLNALGHLAVDQDRAGGIGRIGYCYVAAVEPVHGDTGGQVRADVPLRAEFAVAEGFGFQCLVAGAERGELFSGAGLVCHAVAGVQRDVFDRLVNQASARRQQAVVATECRTGAFVAQVDAEVVVAQPQHGQPLRRKFDLVLHVNRRDLRHAAVIGIGRTEAELHRHWTPRIAQRHPDAACGAARRAKVASLAQVVGLLTPELRARQHHVLQAAGGRLPHQIGLVEEIAAGGRVVVSGQRDRLRDGVHRTWINVLV